MSKKTGKPTKRQIEKFEKVVENGEPIATAAERAGMTFEQFNAYLEQREGGKK